MLRMYHVFKGTLAVERELHISWRFVQCVDVGRCFAPGKGVWESNLSREWEGRSKVRSTGGECNARGSLGFSTSHRNPRRRLRCFEGSIGVG